MAVKVGINGFGRIGRHVFRIAEKKSDVQVVAINDMFDPAQLGILLKYDSVYGRFEGTVDVTSDGFTVNGKKIRVLKEKDPSKLPWKELGVDLVIESTGVFRKREQCAMHIAAGAKKVILTVPSKDPIDRTIVLGVNDEMLKPGDQVLNDNFKIIHGFMTTIHAYTNDQRLLDLPHSDARRARSAAINVIPTTTGAAKAIGEVIPELKGKMDGMAMRVPLPTGSLVDLVAVLEKDVTKEEINAAMKKAAGGPMKGFLEYTEDPIVSSDVVKNPASSVFDALSTMVLSKRLVKVLSWYDNEWGYSNRVVDLIGKLF
jgi:glyceraldehyde 3-phosphate dehydrogenase